MVTVTVTYVFREGTEAQAEAHLRALVAATRTEPGCRAYDVHRSTEHPRTYLIVEVYDDEAAVQAHQATRHFATHGIGGIRTLAESRVAARFEPLVV